MFVNKKGEELNRLLFVAVGRPAHSIWVINCVHAPCCTARGESELAGISEQSDAPQFSGVLTREEG